MFTNNANSEAKIIVFTFLAKQYCPSKKESELVKETKLFEFQKESKTNIKNDFSFCNTKQTKLEILTPT